MKIASINPESMIDYPEKYGPLIFTRGCTFSCGYCHNPELINGDYKLVEELELAAFFKNLEIKTKRGWYTGVCISGGEPTMQKDLPEFISKIKSYGLAVKLDTNGSNPKMIQDLLVGNLVDYVAMDIKGPREKYWRIIKPLNRLKPIPSLDCIDQSIDLVKQFPKYEFRTTVLPYFNESDFESIGGWISNNGNEKVKLYSLQQFNPKETLDPGYGKLIPKTAEEIKSFAKIMEKYSEKVQILGI